MRHLLGDKWHKLHPAIQLHYDETEKISLEGTMREVWFPLYLKPLIVLARMMNALVSRRAKNVRTAVLHSWPRPHVMTWERRFYFESGVPEKFPSRMEFFTGHGIEFVGPDLGIKFFTVVRGGSLVYVVDKYVFRLFGLTISLPSYLGLGGGEIVETGVGSEEITVHFELVHPLLGTTFRYKGEFRVIRH